MKGDSPMTESTTTFTYHDPSRCFDGTPYEAAGKSVQQARLVMLLLARALRDANVQARNAYMSRRLDLGEDDPGAILYPTDAPEARALTHVMTQINNMESALVALDKKLRAVGSAVAYDPKHPPKESDAP